MFIKIIVSNIPVRFIILYDEFTVSLTNFSTLNGAGPYLDGLLIYEQVKK
jgi:hypothetical protein